jgi:hypothetical protein
MIIVYIKDAPDRRRRYGVHRAFYHFEGATLIGESKSYVSLTRAQALFSLARYAGDDGDYTARFSKASRERLLALAKRNPVKLADI